MKFKFNCMSRILTGNTRLERYFARDWIYQVEKERDSVLGKQDDQRRHRGRDAGSEGQ